MSAQLNPQSVIPTLMKLVKGARTAGWTRKGVTSAFADEFSWYKKTLEDPDFSWTVACWESLYESIKVNKDSVSGGRLKNETRRKGTRWKQCVSWWKRRSLRLKLREREKRRSWAFFRLLVVALSAWSGRYFSGSRGEWEGHLVALPATAWMMSRCCAMRYAWRFNLFSLEDGYWRYDHLDTGITPEFLCDSNEVNAVLRRTSHRLPLDTPA